MGFCWPASSSTCHTSNDSRTGLGSDATSPVAKREQHPMILSTESGIRPQRLERAFNTNISGIVANWLVVGNHATGGRAIGRAKRKKGGEPRTTWPDEARRSGNQGPQGVLVGWADQRLSLCY